MSGGARSGGTFALVAAALAMLPTGMAAMSEEEREHDRRARTRADAQTRRYFPEYYPSEPRKLAPAEQATVDAAEAKRARKRAARLAVRGES